MTHAEPIRRYFDNAATTFPKPPCVLEAMQAYMTSVGASAGRGAYREAIASATLLTETRERLKRLFTCRPDDHVVFTLNCSDALNMAIKGLVKPGDHVVTTAMDHNSVLRPLHALAERDGVRFSVVDADPATTLLDPANLEAAITPETRLVAFNHASNVTGVVQPLDAVVEICVRRGVRLVVDAAQSAGHLPIAFGDLAIDALATPGHKGLLGPLGTGVLIVRDEIAQEMRTLREGGTGSASELAEQPADMPDKFEPGSHNAVGLAGLHAALDWLLERGVSNVATEEAALIDQMRTRLDAIDGVTWFGPREASQRVGVFSVRVDGLEPEEVSALLETQAGILTRSGLHCAPLAHKTIGTADRGGTTRLSLGAFHQTADVDCAMDALAEIAHEARLPA